MLSCKKLFFFAIFLGGWVNGASLSSVKEEILLKSIPFLFVAWKRASVWHNEVQIRGIFRSLPKECPKNGKLIRNLRKSLSVPTVLTLQREKIMSRAYFPLASKQLLGDMLPYSKSEWRLQMYIYTSMRNNLCTKRNVWSKKHSAEHWFAVYHLMIQLSILVSQFSIFKLIWTKYMKT